MRKGRVLPGRLTSNVENNSAGLLSGLLAGACLKFCACLLFILFLIFSYGHAHALTLSADLEAILVKNVSTSWQTVSLANTYASAVVVCTYVLPAFGAANPPAVTRIRNITASSFDLRIQGWEDSAATTSNVHCVVADEGAHKLPSGLEFEAHTVVSDQTNGQFATDGAWNLALMEEVTGSVLNSYINPVVQAQVMSYNDNRASTAWLTDCVTRQNEPFAGGSNRICVGKQIGQIASSRNPETIGYIIAEAGSGTANNVFYELALGADSVTGSPNPSFYGLAKDHQISVLTQAGMDGINGGWAVLMGSDPLPSSQMALTIDEEVFVGDQTRAHTAETVYYWAFAGAEVTLQKTVINDNGGVSVIGDFTLSATGPDTISGITGSDSVTEQPVHPGTYLLTETNLPGYVASAWSCTGISPDNFSGNKILLTSGDDVVCTIVNDDEAVSRLTLVKVIKNSNGGGASATDFTLEYDNGSGVSGSGPTGSAAVTSVTVPAGNYSLTESSLKGYELVDIRCDGSDSDGMDGLDLIAAEDVTCQFANRDLGIDLNIEKLASDTTPNIGDVLTFTLQVTNNGPDTATNLSVTDVVPAGFSYVASSIAGGVSSDDTSPTGSGLQWTIASLGTGTTVSLTFQATVLAP